MVNKYTFLKYLDENSEDLGVIVDRDTGMVIDKDTNEEICTIDKFFETYKKKSGESFETLNYDKVALQHVIKCTECGTVIFSGLDEFSYDPHLKCPICVGYETDNEYWTQEEIDFDERKQNYIRCLYEMIEYEKSTEELRKKRNGKNSWEIAIKKIDTKKRRIYIRLECDDVRKSYIRGLKLKIDTCRKDDDGCYTYDKMYTIPLSISAIISSIRARKYFKEMEKNKDESN